jgi:site-specific DNA recombinase
MLELYKDLQLQKEYKEHYLIYTRKSTDDAENQKNSIEYQVAECLRFSQRENLPVAQFSYDGFCQNGVIQEKHSGFKQDKYFEVLKDGTISQRINRPKFLQMAKQMLEKQFKGVICLCWDRISRNETDDVITKKLIKQGVDIRFVQVEYDKSSSGDLHMDLDGAFSRHYSRVISEKVRNATVKLRADGRCIYKAPLGYLDAGSGSKPFDDERAPTVKRIFELYATAEWSYSTLAAWATQQGLTTRPVRRKRTAIEKLNGLELDDIPKVARPLTKRSIENILKNPFYIGLNTSKHGSYSSTSHQPLIDKKLFYSVQELMRKKTVSVRFPNFDFFVYRGLIRCHLCGRMFTPYIKKGITYYTSKCKATCLNNQKTITEEQINQQIGSIFSKIAFTKKELTEIETVAELELEKISSQQQSETRADLDYLMKEKISLLRSFALSVDEIKNEELRLHLLIVELEQKINSNSISAKKMLNYVISFSDLVKQTSTYFPFALGTEKKDLVVETFSELSLENGFLKYRAKEAYNSLLKRFDIQNDQLGWPNYLFSELRQIFRTVKNGIRTGNFASPLPV